MILNILVKHISTCLISWAGHSSAWPAISIKLQFESITSCRLVQITSPLHAAVDFNIGRQFSVCFHQILN